MKTLKIGVIGCGSIAQHRHFPEYANNKNVEVVAVCDIVEERAWKIAEQLELKPIRIIKNCWQTLMWKQ